MLEREAVMTDEVQAGRALVAHVGRMLFDRHLTDACGGNISLLLMMSIACHQRWPGHMRQWQLDAEDVLVVSKHGEILEGAGG